MSCGRWAMDHPHTPYRTLAEPMMTGAVRALRVADAFTDMLEIQLMLQMARSPCVWFGSPGRCSNWVALVTVAGMAAGTDMCLSVFLSVSGSSIGRPHRLEWMQRIITRVHVLSFLRELTVLVITIVKLSSDVATARSPVGSNGGGGRSGGGGGGSGVSTPQQDLRSTAMLTVTSLMVTLTTFACTMLGVRRLKLIAARVVHSATSAVSRASTRTRRGISTLKPSALPTSPPQHAEHACVARDSTPPAAAIAAP
eukprot:jgi/Ulvmu1/6513/UM003_0146.1